MINKVLLISALFPLLSIIAPLNAMAQTQDYAAQFGYIHGFVKNAPMPIDTKTVSQNAIIKNASWYLGEDHNYHIHGFVENTVQSATRLSVSINFWDDATSVSVYPHGSFDYSPSGGVPANLTIPYDMTTGYNISDTKVLKTVNGILS